jgi:hypothetical protein
MLLFAAISRYWIERYRAFLKGDRDVKNIFFLALGLLVVTALPGWAAPPTAGVACPDTFKCTFSAAGTHALLSQATDGHPIGVVGSISFGTGTPVPVEMNEEVNDNGTVTSLSFSGTCTDGTAGTSGAPDTPGTISFTSGPSFSFLIGGFVPSAHQVIRITETDSSNVVLVGFCD